MDKYAGYDALAQLSPIWSLDNIWKRAGKIEVDLTASSNCYPKLH